MPITDNPHRHDTSIGLYAELQVAAAFARIGAVPCVPLRPARFDLVVEQHGELFRVQTKRAQWEEARKNKRGWHDRAHWRVGLISTSASRHTRMRQPYGKADFDFLAMVCDIDRIYMIPVSLLESPTNPGKLMRTLHVKPFTGDEHRRDSWLGAAKWEPYRNRFDLSASLVEVPGYVRARDLKPHQQRPSRLPAG